ncbi:MAG: right-handed parallel beta-helix repeat-containing protein, partial [Candidatus Binatia bacterium]
SGSAGTVRVERDGIVIASLPYTVDQRADCPKADITVPSAEAPTLQAAVAGVADANHDGRLVVHVRPGLYRERVTIDRPLELMGSGRDNTIVQGDGGGTAVTASVAGVIVRGLTVVGGQTGVALAAGARLVDSRVWRNRGAGVVLDGVGAEVVDSAAEANGGAGVWFAAAGASCAGSRLDGNHGPGVDVSGAANASIVGNLLLENAGGVLVNGASGVVVAGNRSVLNLGSGVELLEAEDGTVTNNLCAGNDEDGLSLERADGALIGGNTFDDNNGYGLFVRRTAADFAVAAGIQAPLGDNAASGNRKGDLFVRED